MDQTEQTTTASRIRNSKQAVSYGCIFPCCSCEQMMFEKWKNGSLILDGRLKEEITVKCDSNDVNLFNKVFGKTIK